jgi:predicted Zn-dependent protease
MLNISLRTLFILACALVLFSACDPEPPQAPNEVLASDDPRIGEAIDTEIQNHADTTQTLTILERSAYYRVYNYADSIMTRLLNSNQFVHASDFNWTIRVFEKAGMETAFALPGGYIYLSKDLLLFLENEAEFAGVLAHEMMVADSRIVTMKLKEEFSISYLLDIALGGQVEAAMDVIDNLLYDSYEVEQAEIADNLSRDVICNSDYDIRLYSEFVSRAEDDGYVEWITLYPNSSNWPDELVNSFDVNTCAGEMRNQVAYDKIKMLLIK